MGFARQEYWSGVPSPSPRMDANNPERAMRKPTRVRRGKHKYNNPEQTEDLSTGRRKPDRLTYRGGIGFHTWGFYSEVINNDKNF